MVASVLAQTTIEALHAATGGTESVLAQTTIEPLHAATGGTEAQLSQTTIEVLVIPEFPVTGDFGPGPGLEKGRLGCGINEAFVTFQCGANRVCDLKDATSITWGRRLDEFSEAEVVIPIGGDPDGEGCCDCLGEVEPWCHELHITRDGQEVWVGPIRRVEYGYESITVRAVDMVGWTTVRVIEGDIIADKMLSLIAQDVLIASFADHDPCLLEHLVVNPSLSGAREFLAFADGTAYDILQLLADTGLDFTTLGRAVILGGEDLPGSAVGTLNDEHFVGEIQVIKDGLLAGNVWYQRYIDDDDPVFGIQPGFAEEDEKACYGRIERIRQTDDGIPTEQDADDVANIYLQAAKIVPRLVEMDTGTLVSPRAPVTINQLIPGQRLDIALDNLCFEAYASFKINTVTVQQTNGGDEEVTLELGPVNIVEATQ